MAESFDDAALGETPPKLGTTGKQAASYTNPANPGIAKPTVSADGTENFRADTKTEGPTTYGSAGKGQQSWPSKVNHYKEGDV